MTRTAGGPVRALLLLLGLLGLFTMHGLADHGTSGHHRGPGTAAAAGHHGSHEAATSQPAAAATEVVAAAGSAPLGDPDPAYVALCLAVLLLGLALLLGVGRAERALRRLAPAPRSPVAARPGRGPDPPQLSRLCVLRC